MLENTNDKIFFDTDCLSTFFLIKKENYLLDLYGERITLPCKVFREFTKVPQFRKTIEKYQSYGFFQVEKLNYKTDAGKLYILLTKGNPGFPIIGKGEASVIAMATALNTPMASNNLKDMSYYTQLFHLHNSTTADILKELYITNKASLKEIERMWSNILLFGTKRLLHFESFQEWQLSKSTKNKYH